MVKLLGNAVILVAGSFIMLGVVLALALIVSYVFAVVVVRRMRGITGNADHPLLQG